MCLWIAESNISALISSAGISSPPGDLCFFDFAIAISTSTRLGPGTNGYAHLINEKSSSSTYSKYCGNSQEDQHSHLSLSYFSVGSPS
jgi:hypothetical protein